MGSYRVAPLLGESAVHRRQIVRPDEVVRPLHKTRDRCDQLLRGAVARQDVAGADRSASNLATDLARNAKHPNNLEARHLAEVIERGVLHTPITREQLIQRERAWDTEDAKLQSIARLHAIALIHVLGQRLSLL